MMINPGDVKTDFTILRAERFIRGLLLINKWEGDPDFAAEHDIFYFGKYNPGSMSDDEQRLMFSYGWFEEEDSWAFFT